MNEPSKTSVPAWFWVIAVVALLWNLMGCMILISEVFAKEAMMESFTDAQKEWSRSLPAWVYVVFAVSVGSGIAGSISLLQRKRLSLPLFVISCFAVMIQMVYTMLIAGGLQVMGPSGAIMPALVVGLSIVWLVFSVFSRGKGWLVQG